MPLLSQTENYSDLLNKTLTRTGNKTFEGEEKGWVLNVTVIKDTEEDLELSVFLEGDGEDVYLKTELCNLLGLKKSEIEHPRMVQFPSNGEPTILAYHLGDNAPRGALQKPPFLKVFISKTPSFENKKFAKFNLNKKFFRELLPEEVVVRITPQAIGQASQLVSAQTTSEPENLPTPQKTIQVRDMSTALATSRQIAKNRKAQAINPNLITPTRILLRADIIKANVDKEEAEPEPSKLIHESGLWENLSLKSDIDFSHAYELSNIDLNQIYRKENTNEFYYVPYGFHLKYTDEEGFDFVTAYRTKTEDEENAEILMSCTVTPNLGLKEFAFVKKLLEIKYPDYKNRIILKPIPHKELLIEFRNDMNYLYNITRITNTEINTLKDPIKISWITDVTTMNEIMTSIEEASINGSVKLIPEAGSGVTDTIDIPIQIQFEDEQTLGRIELDQTKWTTQQWKNIAPFPIKLKYVNVLMVGKTAGDQKEGPIVYSWSLNDQIAPQYAQVYFNGYDLPDWLERSDKVYRVWVDYSIEDCEPCRAQLEGQLSLATAHNIRQKISFETFDYFDTYNIQYIRIKIRSRQADPEGTQVLELPMVTADEGGAIFESAELYVPKNEKMSFEYQLSIVTRDGELYSSHRWMHAELSEGETFLIIKSLLEELFPEFFENH
jgi:hypothetical protein